MVQPYRLLPGFLTEADLDALDRQVLPRIPASAWQPGRQGTGYEKLPLRHSAIAALCADILEPLLDRSLRALAVSVIDWDAYVLRYQDGTFVPVHVDPTDQWPHLRLNAVLGRAAYAGGELSLDGNIVPLAPGDAIVFRPDVTPHAVSAVRGVRLVWSVGCVFSDGAR